MAPLIECSLFSMRVVDMNGGHTGSTFHQPLWKRTTGAAITTLSLSFTRSLDYCQRKKVNVVKPEKLDVLWRNWFARAAAAVWGEHFVWHANDNLLWQLLGYLIHSTTTPPPLSLHCSLVFTIVFFVLSCFSTKSILVLVLHRGPNHLLMILLYRYLPSTRILSKLVAMHTCQ